MTRSWIAILWCLIVAIAALAAFAPATWLDRRIGAATDGKLRLTDANGTIWRGSGVLSDAQGTWRAPIAWQLAAWPLLRGAVDIELGSPGDPDAPRGRLQFEPRVVDLRNLRLRVPAAVLNSLAPIKLPAEGGGEFSIDAPAFRYAANQPEGAFDLRWERARFATDVAALDLGTVTAHVAPQGSGLAGKIANVGGDARIDGDVVLSGTGVSVRADIAPGPGVPPEIARMLATLGAPDANGTIHLQWSARR
jgi:Type II secretion system (T2SS), protein N